MTEQLVTRRTRTRKIGTVESAHQTQNNLENSLVEIATKMEAINVLQDQINELEVKASKSMEALNLTKFGVAKASAVYDHPAQRTTNNYDAEGLFEDVTVEDFLASVKVQKSLAIKVIDPKVLKKYTITSKTELKPKVLKVKLL